jgi:hypothetical protein
MLGRQEWVPVSSRQSSLFRESSCAKSVSTNLEKDRKGAALAIEILWSQTYGIYSFVDNVTTALLAR